jgi:hypothetical protein
VDDQLGASDLDVTSDSGSMDIDLNDDTMTFTGTDPIDTAASGTTLTISIDDASTSAKGAASFSSSDFDVSSGAVSIKDNSITLAYMEGLDRGHIIYGDSSGNPASLANSTTDGHVLTVANANGDLGWEAVPGAAGEANQNAWTTFTVPSGTTSQVADSVTDTITFTAAGGMTITGAADDSIEFSSANTNTQLSQEEVEDYAGAMWTGNTETGVTVTYQDSTGDIDIVVDDTTVAGDTGSTGITPGDTLTIAGTTNEITTVMSGDTLTVSLPDNVTIGGNLTVSGTTTTVNSTTVSIADPLFEMGASGSDDNLDRGIIMKYNSSGAKKAFMGYDDSDGKFIMIPDATDTSSVITGTKGTLKANLEGNATGSSGSCTGNSATVTNGVYTSDNLSVMAATSSAQLRGVLSDETGSGVAVFATSPTLTTPALGTPSALVLTNATALPAAQVAQGTMASGMVLVAPVLGTPASGALTNCTALPAAQVSQGTMASGMVLVAPVLGTPASGALTNCTALPAAQVSQGTMASGMIMVAPVLGTPASGNLANCTALRAAQVTAGTMQTGMTLVAPNLGTPASFVLDCGSYTAA